jgi:hypothetical protein
MVSLESRLGAQFGYALFRRLFQVERGRSRPNLAANEFEDLADHPARAAHLLDLLGRLQNHSQNSSQFSVLSSQVSCQPGTPWLTTDD